MENGNFLLNKIRTSLVRSQILKRFFANKKKLFAMEESSLEKVALNYDSAHFPKKKTLKIEHTVPLTF